MKIFYLNHLLLRRLSSIFLVLFLSILSSNFLSAQCSSVSDMVTIIANTGTPTAIDVNSDGINDFEVSYTYITNPVTNMVLIQSVTLTGINGHMILVAAGTGTNAEAIGFGNEICANETYNASVTLYNPPQNVGTAFDNASGAYIGLTNGMNIGFMFIQITGVSTTDITINYSGYGMGMGMNIPVCNGDGAIVGDCNSISVPVELNTFEGKLMDYGIQLRWITESEIENAGFYLERSLDSKNFDLIHWVEGYGNSLVQREYVFHDVKLPLADQYYYRLQQIDKDGNTEYSDTIVIGSARNKTEVGEIYPNPTQVQAWLDLELDQAMEASISIYDLAGRLHTKTQVDLSAGNNILSLSIPEGVTDMLLVKVQLGNKTLVRRVALINE